MKGAGMLRRYLMVLFVAVSMAGFLSSARAADGAGAFGFDLYARHAADPGNVFFSPFSITTALEMTYEGARDITAEEMRSVLHLDADDSSRRDMLKSVISRMKSADKPYELSTANAIWVQKDYQILDDYLVLIRDVYDGEARNVDFSSDSQGARMTINSWVEERTRQRIRDFIPQSGISSRTRMVLTNAVYFKGKWEVPFDKPQTRPDDFRLASGEKVKALMMRALRPALFMEDAEVKMVELPYRGGDLVMRVILPKADIGINAAKLAGWVAQLRTWPLVDLALPKFTFEAFYSMNDDLVALGMADAFSEERADFSGMTGKKDLYIGNVFHKAWIEVTEEGTEAAAATAVQMIAKGFDRPVVMPPRIFHADHPFIFVIQEKISGRILFMGRVADPTKG